MVLNDAGNDVYTIVLRREGYKLPQVRMSEDGNSLEAILEAETLISKDGNSTGLLNGISVEFPVELFGIVRSRVARVMVSTELLFPGYSGPLFMQFRSMDDGAVKLAQGSLLCSIEIGFASGAARKPVQLMESSPCDYAAINKIIDLILDESNYPSFGELFRELLAIHGKYGAEALAKIIHNDFHTSNSSDKGVMRRFIAFMKIDCPYQSRELEGLYREIFERFLPKQFLGHTDSWGKYAMAAARQLAKYNNEEAVPDVIKMYRLINPFGADFDPKMKFDPRMNFDYAFEAQVVELLCLYNSSLIVPCLYASLYVGSHSKEAVMRKLLSLENGDKVIAWADRELVKLTGSVKGVDEFTDFRQNVNWILEHNNPACW